MKFSIGAITALAATLAGDAVAVPFSSPYGQNQDIVPRAIPAGVFPPTNALIRRASGDVQISTVNINKQTIIKKGEIVKNVQNTLQSQQILNGQSNQKRIQFFAKQSPKDTTVMKIVQQVNVVQVSGQTTKSIEMFAQSDITANAGQKLTNTIMITSQNIQDITLSNGNNGGNGGNGGQNTLGLGNNGGNNGNNGNLGNAGNAGNNGNAGTGVGAGAQKTTVSLGDAKPTWTSTAADPAGNGQAKATGKANAGKGKGAGAKEGAKGGAKAQATGKAGAKEGAKAGAKAEGANAGAKAEGANAGAKAEGAKAGAKAEGAKAGAKAEGAGKAEGSAEAKGAPKPAGNVPIFPAAGIKQ